MYLKRLEIIGFKSFAEKTRLDFETGITAIVGPNGCGKTNVIDSIRWVLGEQSAKSLRGSKMEDVIFHGTDERKGIGMAEVSLTFDNSKKFLPLEFSEVTITRRVFRSGESQYFINKNLCRLKDIDALFMDTGVGMRAYSVFEQGRMDLILSSRPEDRRFIFEEAAGITKYKESKKETLHKLENTENNLVRINDIIKEVQRQLNSIERQAAKARRFKKIQEELKTQEVKLLVYQLRDLQAKSSEFEKDKSITEQQAMQLRETIRAKEEKLEELRQMLRQIDAEIAAIQDKKITVETKLVENKNHIQYKNNKITELAERNKKIDIEAKQIEEKLIGLRSNLEGLISELALAKNSKNEYKGIIDQKYSIVKTLDKQYEELGSTISSKKDLLVGKTANESHIKNEITNIEYELRDIALKNRKDSIELSKKRKQKDILSQELEKMESVLFLQKESLLSIRQIIKDHEEKVLLLKDESDTIRKNLKDKEHYFAEKRSEYEIFTNQKKAFEGYGDGVKKVLENKDEFPGIVGLVNDLINIPKEYTCAVSSALGQKIQWFVVDTLENAYKAAVKLNDSDVSQTGFIVLELLPEADIIQNFKDGIRAIDVVTFDKKYEKLAVVLLGKLLIINDLQGIDVLIKDFGNQGIIATRNGLVVDAAGTISGGKASGNISYLVSRNNDIDELRVILNDISNDILSATERLNVFQGRLSYEERQLEVSKNNLYNEEIALGVQENDFLRHKASYESICEEIKVIEMEDEEEGVQKEQLSETKIKKEEELRLIGEEIKSIYRDVEQGSQLIKDVQSKKQNEEREYTEIKITLISAEEKENLLEFKRAEIQKQIDSMLESLQKYSGEKVENTSTAGALTQEIIKLEEELSLFSVDGTDIVKEVDDARSKRKEIETEILNQEDILRKERQSTDEVYSQLNERKLKYSEMQLNIDNIMQKLLNEYKLNQESINSTSLEGISIELLEQEILTLRDKLEGMGEVSLMAIEEQDELVKRYEFLTTQQEDLVNAKDSLLKAIAKLNTTTKKLFWDTFCQIKENFSNIFCQLFGGGKADLVLIDESDILESGIEIIARPPGKRLQNVSLLSGGEKALTAVALLFSIFKVKPSPFCIMDEIDAPLDDSNIDRFVQLLKEFSKNSQFLIVTHNKRSINSAASLYGITMQESGVSNVVSVKFSEANAAVK